jgi:hypothetical protein
VCLDLHDKLTILAKKIYDKFRLIGEIKKIKIL